MTDTVFTKARIIKVDVKLTGRCIYEDLTRNDY
jgi:hypothetical protein